MSAFHAIVAAIILFVPRDQVVTPRTSAIFGTIPPIAWVVMFTLTAIAAACATARQTPTRLLLTWCQVFPIGGAWIYGFGASLPQGQGSAIFPVLWVFLLIWWGLTAVRTLNGEQGNRWNGEA